MFVFFLLVSKEKPRPIPIDVEGVTPLAAWIPPLGYLSIGVAGLALVSSAAASFLSSPSCSFLRKCNHSALPFEKQSYLKRWVFLLSLLLILTFSFLCGVVTLRKRIVSDSDRFMLSEVSYLAPYGKDEITHNHKETDELIFETLTATVSKNFFDYSLQTSGIIDTFQLSKENYNDDIFIHPPFFVYSLYFLLQWCGVPLVLASILFHTLTAALVPLLVLGLSTCLLPLTTAAHNTNTAVSTSIHKNHIHPSRERNATTTNSTAYASGLWATVVFIACPIGRMCSQKIWIDNAAVFTATLAAVAHIFLLQNSRNVLHNAVHRRNFLSGLIFGLIALNCKITSLAMLPFLLSWTVLVGVLSHPDSAPGSFLSHCHISRMICSCVCFVGGTVIGHGPWVYVYYVSTYLLEGSVLNIVL
jgi:hypothetical protein